MHPKTFEWELEFRTSWEVINEIGCCEQGMRQETKGAGLVKVGSFSTRR